jgi:apolipoprotein N-acyltransferase
MIISDTEGLIKDIEFAFILPFVAFVMAMINIRMTPRSKFNSLKFRLSLSFVIALFVWLLSSLLLEDKRVLIALWIASPVLYSFLYSLSCLLVVAAVIGLLYWKLRPEKWKDRGED